MADESDITNEQIAALGQAAQRAKDQFGEASDEYKQATKNLQNAALAQNRNTKATQANTQSAYAATTASGAMAQGLGKVTTGTVAYARKLSEAASDMRENRESFTSLDSSIRMTGDAVSMIGKTAGLAFDAIGDMVVVLTNLSELRGYNIEECIALELPNLMLAG